MADPRLIVHALAVAHGPSGEVLGTGTGDLAICARQHRRDEGTAGQLTLCASKRFNALYAAFVPVDQQQAGTSPSPAPQAPLRLPLEIHHQQASAFASA